jgi:prepilin peptidase CpaA
MLARYVLLIVLLLLTLISDIKSFKITNMITISFSVAGLILNLLAFGCGGLAYGIIGWITPVIVLLPFFLLKMLGAGDIKLFSAIGVIMGYKFALFTILFSFLFGGFIAVIVMLFRKNAIKRLIGFFRYLKACFLCANLLEYTDNNVKSGNGRFRFSYAIVPGAIFQIVLLISDKSI